MKIRCKFKVQSLTQQEFGDSLEAAPVYQGEEGSENAEFWAATPSGSLHLTCVKAGAFSHLKPGQEFYLDLTPCE